MGRVRGAHGLRGRLRVQCYGDSAEVLPGLEKVLLGRDGDDPDATPYPVEAVAPGRGDEVRMSLAGVRHREQAEELIGRWVLSDATGFASLPPGEYWGFQLIGCRVETRDGRGVGVVREVWHTGAQQLLVVADASGREQLIPAVREFCQVDLEERRILVDAIPGLLEGS